MSLKERIEHIIYKEGIKVKDFLERSNIPQASYYRVKKGEKTELKPDEANRIITAFPSYQYDWLMGKSVSDSLDVNNATILQLAEAGLLGKVMLAHHKELLKIDPTYGLWYDKEIHAGAIKILKDMRLND